MASTSFSRRYSHPVHSGSGRKHLIGALVVIALLPLRVMAGANVQINVTDAGGRPVQDVVVTLEKIDGGAANTGRGETVMDQVRKNFEPRILIVRTGSAVEFPNSDSIAHQVYSFSPTKRFELPLYRGKAPTPVIFDKPGIVVLGCNIHDNMVGYIYVTDAAYFAKTDADGRVELHGVREARYRVSAWTPRSPAGELPRASELSVDSDAMLTIRFEHSLRSPSSDAGDTRLRDY